MTKHFCDRCGTVVDEHRMRYLEYHGEGPVFTMALCPLCYASVIDFATAAKKRAAKIKGL